MSSKFTSGFERTVISIDPDQSLCVALCLWPLTLYPPCVVVAPSRKIWDVTAEPNSNYTNINWRHNFPAGSSEFVLEFTLDSKNPDRGQSELPKPRAWPDLNEEWEKTRPEWWSSRSRQNRWWNKQIWDCLPSELLSINTVSIAVLLLTAKQQLYRPDIVKSRSVMFTGTWLQEWTWSPSFRNPP